MIKDHRMVLYYRSNRQETTQKPEESLMSHGVLAPVFSSDLKI